MHVTMDANPTETILYTRIILTTHWGKVQSFLIPYPIIAKCSIASPKHHSVKIILSERRNETWILVVLILVVMKTLPAGFTSDRSPWLISWFISITYVVNMQHVDSTFSSHTRCLPMTLLNAEDGMWSVLIGYHTIMYLHIFHVYLKKTHSPYAYLAYRPMESRSMYSAARLTGICEVMYATIGRGDDPSPPSPTFSTTIFSSKTFNKTPKSINHNIYTLSSFLNPIPRFTDPREQILQGL